MRRILLTPHGFSYSNCAFSMCRKADAMVRVTAVGLCGSDIKKINNFARYGSEPDIILGHEVVGTSDRNGSFAILPFIGFETMRSDCTFAFLDSIGKKYPGGFQEYVEVPRQNLFDVGQMLSKIEATMVDPLAVVLHGLRKLGVQSDLRIAIVGDGPIALISAQLLSDLNDVFLFAKHKRNREVAESYGIKTFERSEIGVHADKFNAVVEAVGGKEALDSSVHICAKGGKILVFGVYPKGEVPLLIRNAFYKELVIIGTNSYGVSNGFNEFQLALDLLIQRRIDVKRMITHIIPFEDYTKIPQILAHRDDEGLIKMVLTW